ncbi:hypothetical protein [Dactylosporangium salmoneum]
MSTTTLVRSVRSAGSAPAPAAVVALVDSSAAHDVVALEHVHVMTSAERIVVTLFVMAAGQLEADAVALLVGDRLCGLLPGWRPTG